MAYQVQSFVCQQGLLPFPKLQVLRNIILQVLTIDCDECPKSPIDSYNGLLSLAHKENDPIEQNKLIAQQNKLISYISGLGIGVSSSDTVLLKKFKPLR